MYNLSLYRHKLSGHCHRVELFLSLLKLEINIIDIDLARGQHKQAEFLAKNPLGQVPVLTDGEVILFDSNAILVYLAKNYAPESYWYPSDPLLAAQVQQFLSIAAGPIANGPAAARLITIFGAELDYSKAIEIATAILTTINKQLQDREWLVGSKPTIADLSTYSYIAHAPEGGISLAPYRNVLNWLSRIEALDGFLPMQKTDTGVLVS